MKINKNNYEEYAIDYLDGTLSPQLIKAFESFLRANPEVAEELKGLNEAALYPEIMGPAVFFQKKQEVYQNSPLVAVLNRPFQFRMWQIAASLLLLLSAAWIGMQVYTPPTGGLQVAETTPIIPEEPTETLKGERELAISSTTYSPADPPIIEKTEESEPAVVVHKQQAIVKEKKEELFIEETAVAVAETTSEEAQELLEAVTEAETRPEAEEPYAFIDLNETVKSVLCDEVEIDRFNQSPSAVSSLPARSIQPPGEENRPTICEKRMPADFNKKGANEETAGSFLVRLADRVVPFPLAEWIDPSNININTDRIPQSLLPEMVKQNSL